MRRFLLEYTMVCGAFALASAEAAARFLETDADRIDPDNAPGTETILDSISYRPPEIYNDLWDNADTGFMTSAGSYTIRRFDFSEAIKVSTPPEGREGAAFVQARQEDLVDERTERSVRLWTGLQDTPWRLALLGDGGTYKEYGDVGVATGFWRNRRQRMEIQLWSVDHFYATKRTELADSRPRQTRTVALDLDWSFAAWRLRLSGGVDTPLVWRRPSRGYTYEYERKVAKYQIDFPLSQALVATARGTGERKRESKRWESDGLIDYTKGLDRVVGTHEVKLVARNGPTIDSIGLLHLTRDTRFSSAMLTAAATEDPPELIPPPFSRRRELSVYATRWGPASWSNETVQYGIFIDPVHIREGDSEWRQIEAKAQLAWDHAFTPKAHVLLNSTWDLDKIGRHFPYRKQRFRPWGGGNIQIVAAF